MKCIGIVEVKSIMHIEEKTHTYTYAHITMYTGNNEDFVKEHS